METISKEQALSFLELLGEHAKEYAGIPMPIEGYRLSVHPSYRFHDALRPIDEPDPDPEAEKFMLMNTWTTRRGRTVMVVRNSSGRSLAYTVESPKAIDYAANTLGLMTAWTIDAEIKAMSKLADLVSRHQMNLYIMTGSFIETSRRSGVSYLFRRLRPTVAMRDGQNGIRVLAALCSHPIGYYQNTHGGSLVPTDDVVAHLLMMRGDEAAFWKLSNQHQPGTPQAAI